MTAVNVIVGEAVHIVTDSLVLQFPGHETIGFVPKVFTLPHLRAAVAVSGPAGLTHRVGDVLYARALDVDELMNEDALREVAREVSQWLVVNAEVHPAGTMRILVGGHSPRHGPAAWCLDGDRFTMASKGQYFCNPGVPGFPLVSDVHPDFEACVLHLIECQRQDHGVVGGSIVLTTITPDSITQKVLHRYADRIGDAMRPRPKAGVTGL